MKELDYKKIKEIAQDLIKMQNEDHHKLYHPSVYGIEGWLADIYNFSKGKTWVPTCRIGYNVNKAEYDGNFGMFRKGRKVIYTTFSNKLLRVFLKELDKIYKSYEVLIKYGFRGFSTGGQNGVFYQRKQDLTLMTSTEKLLKQSDHQEAISYELGYFPDRYHLLKKVKIVWHEPKGIRIVGVADEKITKIYFMDFAKY